MKQAVKLKPATLVKVILLTSEGGGYAINEYEILQSLLESNGVLLSKSEPDIFSIAIMNLTKKAREILGI